MFDSTGAQLCAEVAASPLGERMLRADAAREVRAELVQVGKGLPGEGEHGLALLEGRKASPFLNAAIAHLLEAEARMCTQGIRTFSWGPSVLPYSRLWMHLDRLTLCGQQGSFMRCSNSECAEGVFVPGSCSSSLCSRCAKIQTQRIRKKLERDMAPAPHHYLVFTLPEELRGVPGDWGIVDKLHVAVRRTLRRWLGPQWQEKKARWWAAWAAPHTYGSASLSWHPHLNVLLATEAHLAGATLGDLRERLPYDKLRDIYRGELVRAFGPFSGELAQPEAQLMGKRRVLRSLLDYCRRFPLPRTYSAVGDDSARFAIPHGSKHHPEITRTWAEILDILEAHLPPKNYRAVRRWGLYSPRNAHYENPPWKKPEPKTKSCKCCGGVQVPVVRFAPGRVAEVRALDLTTGTSVPVLISIGGSDVLAARPALRCYLEACKLSMEQHTGPPPWDEWREKLKLEHALLCPHARHRAYMDHNTMVLDILKASKPDSAPQAPASPQPAQPPDTRKLELLRDLRAAQHFGVVPVWFAGGRVAMEATITRLEKELDLKVSHT